jgi:hypothetical protein
LTLRDLIGVENDTDVEVEQLSESKSLSLIALADLDTISIADLSNNLKGYCLRIFRILVIMKRSQKVKPAVRLLATELGSLSEILVSIFQSFSDPSVLVTAPDQQTGHEGRLWKNVKQVMYDCRQTLERLQQHLVKSNEQSSADRHSRSPHLYFKLDMTSTEIVELFQQFSAYRETLGLSRQLIKLYLLCMLF